MARARVVLVAGMLALVAAAPAHALNGVFKGAKSARILISDLSDAGRTCGLGPEPIMATVVDRLGTTNLLIDAPGNPDFTVYVDVKTVQVTGGDCVSNVTFRAANHEDVKFTFSRIERSFPVILFEQSGLYGSPPAAHTKAINNGLGGMVEKFASDYDLDTRW